MRIIPALTLGEVRSSVGTLRAVAARLRSLSFAQCYRATRAASGQPPIFSQLLSEGTALLRGLLQNRLEIHGADQLMQIIRVESQHFCRDLVIVIGLFERLQNHLALGIFDCFFV